MRSSSQILNMPLANALNDRDTLIFLIKVLPMADCENIAHQYRIYSFEDALKESALGIATADNFVKRWEHINQQTMASSSETLSNLLKSVGLPLDESRNGIVGYDAEDINDSVHFSNVVKTKKLSKITSQIVPKNFWNYRSGRNHISDMYKNWLDKAVDQFIHNGNSVHEFLNEITKKCCSIIQKYQR
ncbi:hypothetical protein WR164_08390 [Philodulcilactobacillus myokoensis]|uniref:Uncharacterized protein n=1 Tax=Philodulcilactobacillus myokoensis TaxID=2929573 RepID=A0A9W6B1M1_9LACO|nr:hypothetical protein [Philodulcilactobacillus myokoensis]GLB46860.1 hypothetical protein WR164_08390 [Philodulcilactobacillus myokoensis]